MQTGALTSYIDVAQVVLYAFWVFFFGLIIYLRREDKREGYPLEDDLPDAEGNIRLKTFSIPALPQPKTFLLPEGGTYSAPHDRRDRRPIAAVPTSRFPGAPLEPTGNPMLDGVGPASYAERSDLPDMGLDGQPRILPLRLARELYVVERDPNLMGMSVVGANGNVAGMVSDLWVDRTDMLIRYLEVELRSEYGGHRVLLPMTLARIKPQRYAGPDGHITQRIVKNRPREVRVISILAPQFAHVPTLQNPDQVTRQEEDKITAYYASGHRYAVPSRLGPVL